MEIPSAADVAANPSVQPATAAVNTSTTIQSNQENLNANQYSWTLDRQFPVKISANLFSQHQSVLLKVFINKLGEVVAVERVLATTPENIVQQAERSLKRWRFAAPVDQGIKDDLLSRVFKVELTAR